MLAKMKKILKPRCHRTTTNTNLVGSKRHVGGKAERREPYDICSN